MSSSEGVYPGIGQLNEGPLHAALKNRYAHSGELEVPIGGFVADAVYDGVIYEIQTGSFSEHYFYRKIILVDEPRNVDQLRQDIAHLTPFWDFTSAYLPAFFFRQLHHHRMLRNGMY